jgi:hypothetical protein
MEKNTTVARSFFHAVQHILYKCEVYSGDVSVCLLGWCTVCTCDDPDHDRQPDQVKVIISNARQSEVAAQFDKKLKDFRKGVKIVN